jgi:hypothetical protein
MGFALLCKDFEDAMRRVWAAFEVVPLSAFISGAFVPYSGRIVRNCERMAR